MVVEVMNMKEENKASKNKWSKIFRKKWFFPALYLGIAALLLSVVVWYQNVGNQVPEAEDNEELPGDVASNLYDEDAEAVMDEQEVVKMPVAESEQAEIVTKFYDYNSEEEDQENALVLYNNRYHQSTGIDIASEDGETFDVTASLSGTVQEVKEDPLLGNVVVLDHDNGVTTYYASLADVQVQAGVDVKQGDLLGQAGKNIFGKDNGNHVHFELRKDGQEVNPEDYFNQPVSQLDSVTEETEEDADETSGDFNPNDRSNELDGMEENPVNQEEDVDDPELEDEDTPVEDEEEEDDNPAEEDNEDDEDTSENS